MDQRLSPSELRFREELCSWLDAVAVPAGLRDYGSTPTTDDLGPGRAWQRELHRAGWAALSWPHPHGRGASMAEQAIFAEEMARRTCPRQLSFVTMELAGPILLRSGTPGQVAALVAPMASGDSIWCQLFSEPEAGSDLAALRTSDPG